MKNDCSGRTGTRPPSMSMNAPASRTHASALQGYLASKKTHPPMTLGSGLGYSGTVFPVKLLITACKFLPNILVVQAGSLLMKDVPLYMYRFRAKRKRFKDFNLEARASI